MNRNWSIILALVGALLAYDMFVLRPYNQKQAAALKTKSAQEVTDKPQGSLQPTNSVEGIKAAPTTVDAIAAKPALNLAVEKTKVDEISLGAQRKVNLYSDASLAQAVFNDYFQRGTETKEPVVQSYEIAWQSTNPQVAQCLKALKYEGNYVFSSSVAGLECRLSYSILPELKGKLSVVFDVKGIQNYQGVVGLKTYDTIGKDDRFDFKKIDYKLNDDVENIRGDSLLEAKAHRGDLDWLVWGDKYFAAVLIPKGILNPDLVIQPVVEQGVIEENRHFQSVLQYPVVNTGAESFRIELGAYLGTRDLDSFAAMDKELVAAVDMGWFASVGRFMLWSLEKLNLLFHNFGWSIIALTLLVRIAFWPLNKKVFASGQKMKDLQPKIEALKKKYDGDKSRAAEMNQEMMALYKTEKVNPAGSCLPMLLQMPIFIGLYGALGNAIDLYQAPFMFWIEDLSSPDKFYVLPALWTLSMLAMMKYTPQPTTQQPGMPDMKKVMFVMYIVFGFMAKDWPSGLCLYLVVSSVVGTLQQMFFHRDQKKLKLVQEGA